MSGAYEDASRRVIKAIDAIKELQRKAVGIKKTNDLPPAFTGVAQAFSVAEQVLSCI